MSGLIQWPRRRVTVGELADRLEAARHNPGNAAAMREALNKAAVLLAVCEWPDGINMEAVEEIKREIDAALNVPPHNCDVETATCMRKDRVVGVYGNAVNVSEYMANMDDMNVLLAPCPRCGCADPLVVECTNFRVICPFCGHSAEWVWRSTCDKAVSAWNDAAKKGSTK